MPVDKTESQYKVLFEKSPDALLVIDGSAFVDCNQATIDMLGYESKQDVYNIHPSILSPQYQPDGQLSEIKAEQMIKTAFKNGSHRFEWEHVKKNGDIFPVEVLLIVIPSDDKELLHVVWRDITERKKKEEKIRSSQKLEALGKLTGGIAHDYNNMLNIIGGYAELIRDDTLTIPTLNKYAQEILSASKRGSTLTRKLLAFTKQKTSEVKVIDINILLQEQKLMLEKTLTSKISLHYELEEEVWTTELDPGDLEDAIINFSINALHAMKSNGQLSIRTSNEHLNEQDAKTCGLRSGDYVMLSISDTGCGMESKTKDKIFDPFFTTKGDKGSGLGLSQVHGFVERSRGKIQVFSKLGYGTRFTIYFPKSSKNVDFTTLTESVDKSKFKGTETILVVDDEPSIANLTQEVLSAQGYKVLMANSGEQALSILENHTIDLMISDVVMPHMDGYQLANHVQNLFPDISIQMVSGFEDDHHKNIENNELRKNILYKPYSSHSLLEHVRKILDANKPLEDHPEKTLLIMDDEKGLRDLFKIILSGLNYKVLTTCSGEETISLYQQALNQGESIDLFILDYLIPEGMGGMETHSKLRKMNPAAKIILTSGDPERDEMKNYEKYDFDGVLNKVFDLKIIQKTIEDVICK